MNVFHRLLMLFLKRGKVIKDKIISVNMIGLREELKHVPSLSMTEILFVMRKMLHMILLYFTI